MKALPLWQPWATLVAIGAKRVETRGYPPRRFGLVAGERIAIYATKGLGNPRLGGLTEADLHALCSELVFHQALQNADLGDELGTVDPARLPRGMVVATCVIDRASEMTEESIAYLMGHNLEEHAFGFYAPGRWAWVLRDVEELDPPIAARPQGRGTFEWDPEAAIA
jgi:hypothetical protein